MTEKDLPKSAEIEIVGPNLPVLDFDAASLQRAGRIEPDEQRSASIFLGQHYRRGDLVALSTLRPGLVDCIRADVPELPDIALVSIRTLAKYRMRHLSDLLQQEHGELSALDRQVAASIARQDTIAENVEAQFQQRLSLGERLADQMSRFGGSWWFLLSFGLVLLTWIVLNIMQGGGAFDPYPFILLNLILSCLAAIQAPVIIMSQRRLEERDRARADNDYRVNLKAELEIRHLHEKLDYLISRQWDRLIEIQQMQIEILQEAKRR